MPIMAFYHAQQAVHQPNPDIFIENVDTPQAPPMGTREAAKMIARQRQDIIGSELSRLAGEEYLEDIMRHMKHMEVSN